MAQHLAIVTHNIIKGDGQGRVALAIAQRALHEGWEVDLIALRVEPSLLESGARHIPIPLSPLGKRTAFFRGIEGVRFADNYLRQHGARYDVILGYGYTLTYPHQVNNAQFCHHAWGKYVATSGMAEASAKTPYQRVYTAQNKWGELKAFAQSEKIICCAHRVQQELLEIGVPRHKLEVIFNGADPDEFMTAPLPRARFGLPESVPMAVFAGDIRSARKNLAAVIQALTQVEGLHVAVIGEQLRSPYPALAAELGVADRVHFLGFRRDVADVMRTCDFFVFPSRYEPFGMVALEAAFCGLPLILPECVGAVEVVRTGAIVIDTPENIPALTEAMRRLAHDPELRKTLGANGLHARELCNWKTLTDRWMEVFEEVRRR